jgi:replication fork clamp-binding protein CrfC
MDRKDFISDNLRKISSELRDVAKNGVNLPVFESEKTVEPSERVASNGSFSKAQENRLADVYKAKLDILDRVSKSIALLQEAEKTCVMRLEEQRKFITELSGKLEKIKNLKEPDSVKDLTEYIRSVEYFRMDFFAAEAKFEQGVNESINSSAQKSSTLDIGGFYGQLKSITRLLIVLIVALFFGGILISAAIWFSMNL